MSLPDEILLKLYEAYKQKDIENQNQIGYNQVAEILKELHLLQFHITALQTKPLAQEKWQLFLNLPTPGVPFEEMIDLLEVTLAVDHDLMTRKFEEFDINCSGFIEVEDFYDKMVLMNAPDASLEVAERIIRQADKDNDGKLSYQEFCRAMSFPFYDE